MTAPAASQCQFLDLIEQSMNCLMCEMDTIEMPTQETASFMSTYAKYFQIKNAKRHLMNLLKDWENDRVIIERYKAKQSFQQ